MTAERSRYRPDALPNYSHRFHVGNVGDVWKHCALVELLRTTASAGSVAYIETHAGEGRYALAPTGEWTEGIGKLWDASIGAAGDSAAVRYVVTCKELGAGDTRPENYPGSPLFARAVLGASARLVLWERDPAAAECLRASMGTAASAHVHEGDGLVHVADAIGAAERENDETIVFIDPPWTQKADWNVIPDALARAVQGSRRARFMLWYPVKSLTRPNAMIRRLAAGGVAATIVELVTTPLEQRRNRLNGSGVLLVRPPAGVLEAIAAAAPRIAEHCATRAGTWSCRIQSFAPADI